MTLTTRPLINNKTRHIIPLRYELFNTDRYRIAPAERFTRGIIGGFRFLPDDDDDDDKDSEGAGEGGDGSYGSSDDGSDAFAPVKRIDVLEASFTGGPTEAELVLCTFLHVPFRAVASSSSSSSSFSSSSGDDVNNNTDGIAVISAFLRELDDSRWPTDLFMAGNTVTAQQATGVCCMAYFA